MAELEDALHWEKVHEAEDSELVAEPVDTRPIFQLFTVDSCMNLQDSPYKGSSLDA